MRGEICLIDVLTNPPYSTVNAETAFPPNPARCLGLTGPSTIAPMDSSEES